MLLASLAGLWVVGLVVGYGLIPSDDVLCLALVMVTIVTTRHSDPFVAEVSELEAPSTV